MIERPWLRTEGKGSRKMEKIRTFVAVKIPEEVREEIGAVQSQLMKSGAEVKWVTPANFHITLKFLGYLLGEEVEKVISKVKEALQRCRGFFVSFRQLGAFPKLEMPKTIWLSVDKGANEVCQLAKVIEDELVKAGFPAENREFKAHLTLGRLKSTRGVDALIRALKGIKPEETANFFVDRVFVMKSDLMPSGPVYSVLAEIEFGVKS